MNDTVLTAGAALVFASGLALGLWLRGWLIMSQEATRRAHLEERRGRRKCDEEKRDLMEELRRVAAERDDIERNNWILREVVSGNLFPDILRRAPEDRIG